MKNIGPPRGNRLAEKLVHPAFSIGISPLKSFLSLGRDSLLCYNGYTTLNLEDDCSATICKTFSKAYLYIQSNFPFTSLFL
jgi:hypothetical protein